VVDDLYTLSRYRRRGFAGTLFSWVKQHARESNCEHICLNSSPQRKDAHRFYLNHGLHFESLHFGAKVSEF
jgi:GNAT superfamily N-acetyltransferase